jgi:molecular chaperone GrpE
MSSEFDTHKEPNPAPELAEAAKTVPADAERIAQLERDNADLKDRLLRSLAEMENLRRRSEREIQDGRAYGITNFARDMLNSADNLHRALKALPATEGEEAVERDAAFTTFVEGVELTERELIKTLERHGVKKREPMGERFDPHRDQAMFEVPDETKISGTVIQIVQTGYVIGDRVLRPALVGVSKGGPARAPVETAATTEPEKAPAEKPSADASSKPRFDKRA